MKICILCNVQYCTALKPVQCTVGDEISTVQWIDKDSGVKKIRGGTSEEGSAMVGEGGR